MIDEIYVSDQLMEEHGQILATLDEDGLQAGTIRGAFILDGEMWVATGASRKDGRVIRVWAHRIVPLDEWPGDRPIRTVQELRNGQTYIRSETIAGMRVEWYGRPFVLGQHAMLTPESRRPKPAGEAPAFRLFAPPAGQEAPRGDERRGAPPVRDQGRLF